MALNLQQVQRQTQRLIMTPQMQQSIQLLQLNAIELEQLAEQELTENPFLTLEEGEDEASPGDRETTENAAAEAPERETENDWESAEGQGDIALEAGTETETIGEAPEDMLMLSPGSAEPAEAPETTP